MSSPDSIRKEEEEEKEKEKMEKEEKEEKEVGFGAEGCSRGLRLGQR